MNQMDDQLRSITGSLNVENKQPTESTLKIGVSKEAQKRANKPEIKSMSLKQKYSTIDKKLDMIASVEKKIDVLSGTMTQKVSTPDNKPNLKKELVENNTAIDIETPGKPLLEEQLQKTELKETIKVEQKFEQPKHTIQMRGATHRQVTNSQLWSSQKPSIRNFTGKKNNPFLN